MAQGRSGGAPGGAPGGGAAGSAGSAPFGTGPFVGGSPFGTPATPASGGLGPEFGHSVRDTARVNRQSSHANENAAANANANAGLGSATTTSSSAQLGPAQTGQPNVECEAGETPGHAADAPGSAFNEDGHAGTVYAGEQPQNSRNTASVSQYDVACAHQPSH